MLRRYGHVISSGWLGLGLLALIAGPLLPAGAVAQVVDLGTKVTDGMSIRMWLEEPKPMQMFMKGQGKWMSFRPKSGALTHHLGVDLTVPQSGERIPYAEIDATLTNRGTGTRMTKNLPAMFGSHLFYGINLKLEPGDYDLVINVKPATMMRMEGAFDKWLEPIEARFAFEVK